MHRSMAVLSLSTLFLCFCSHHNDSNPIRLGTEEGSFVFFDTPRVTHTIDYYSFAPFIPDTTPDNWYYPVNYTAGRFLFQVEIDSVKDLSALPFYYSVTWQRGYGSRDFLRVSVEVDHVPGVFEATGNVQDLEWSPDGGCCQTIAGKYWPWDAAWSQVGGDVIAMHGWENTFPVVAKARMVFFSRNFL